MDNELRCVTTQRISQSLNLTRQQGSLMLEEILKERSSSSKSQITYCQKSIEGDNTTGMSVDDFICVFFQAAQLAGIALLLESIIPSL